MKDAIATFTRLGIMGFLAVVIVCTLVGMAVYGFVVRPDHDLTAQLVGILGVGAGALLTAVGVFFGAKREEEKPLHPDYFDPGPPLPPAEPPSPNLRAAVSRNLQLAALCKQMVEDGTQGRGDLSVKARKLAMSFLDRAKELEEELTDSEGEGDLPH